MATSIERDNYCFGCGSENERGMRLTFAREPDGTTETSLTVPEWFSGWKGIAHGGFLSTILDEIMGQACIGIAQSAVTVELAVKFLKSVETGSHIRAVGKVREARGRVIQTEGWLYSEDGTVVASASARFIAATPK